MVALSLPPSEPPPIDLYGQALGRVLYPAWEWLRGRPTFDLLAQLRRTERASLDELTVLRTGSLRRLLRHAYYHTPYYRRVFDERGLRPEDIRDLGDLQHVPLLDRATAQRTVDERTAAWPAAAFSKSTSGSTGQPLVVRYSAESRHWRDATRWRGFGWGSYRMGDKALHLWGVPATRPPWIQRMKLALDRKLRRDVYASCMVRSRDRLREMVDLILEERPQVIAGYGQAIADLARFVNAEGLRRWGTIPVIYGAERLWPNDRVDIAEAFGPAVFETYGCREFMLIGAECEAHDGLHESVENLVVELLVRTPDGGMRPARPGEQGEVAVTDLHNLACPFIRYLIGDLVIARAPAPCSCGRTLPRFGSIEGRVTDTMRDAEGNPVEGILFNILFLDMAKHARQFQVVQRADRRLVLRVVPAGEQLAPAAEAKIRQFVGEHVRGVPFDIEVVREIPLTHAGKLRRVIVEPRAAEASCA
jgi:phenylacetate-CoA ligase